MFKNNSTIIVQRGTLSEMKYCWFFFAISLTYKSQKQVYTALGKHIRLHLSNIGFIL